jgi:multisubunit Na+/H+ antiporter MnhB subunit
MDLQIGQAGVMAMTLAVTEALKSIFNVQGKWNQLVAVFVGMLLTAIAYGINYNLIPENLVSYVQWVIISFGGGLSAIGVFDFIKYELKLVK